MSDLKTYLNLTRYRKTFERTLHQIDLALLLREMREDVGLTQAELAKKAGTTQSVIETKEYRDRDRNRHGRLEEDAIDDGNLLE
jgi:DNA-binding XRE family transcriptional regulator